MSKIKQLPVVRPRHRAYSGSFGWGPFPFGNGQSFVCRILPGLRNYRGPRSHLRTSRLDRSALCISQQNSCLAAGAILSSGGAHKCRSTFRRDRVTPHSCESPKCHSASQTASSIAMSVLPSCPAGRGQIAFYEQYFFLYGQYFFLRNLSSALSRPQVRRSRLQALRGRGLGEGAMRLRGGWGALEF